jgi:uncharacterized membrane protein
MFFFGQIFATWRIVSQISENILFFMLFFPFFKLKTFSRFLQEVLAGSQNITFIFGR